MSLVPVMREVMRNPLQRGRGGFSPAQISFTSGLWLDQSDIATGFQDSAGTIPQTASGQPTGKRLDKSGLGNHVTQSAGAARPEFDIIGGRYSDYGDGADDKLSAADSASLRQATFTFVIGVKTAGLLGRDDWFSCGSEASFATNNYIFGTNGSTLNFYGRTPASALSLGTLTTNTAYVISIVADGVNITPRINGVAGGAQACTLGTDNTTGFTVLGNSSVTGFANIDLYGLIICPNQSAVVLALLERWMAGKVGATF